MDRLSNLARLLGSLMIMTLMGLTFGLVIFLLPGLPEEGSLIDWQTFIILTCWMGGLSGLYVLITRAFFVNVLLLPIIYGWGMLLTSQFNSRYTVIDIAISVVGLCVTLLAFIFIWVKQWGKVKLMLRNYVWK